MLVVLGGLGGEVLVSWWSRRSWWRLWQSTLGGLGGAGGLGGPVLVV